VYVGQSPAATGCGLEVHFPSCVHQAGTAGLHEMGQGEVGNAGLNKLKDDRVR